MMLYINQKICKWSTQRPSQINKKLFESLILIKYVIKLKGSKTSYLLYIYILYKLKSLNINVLMTFLSHTLEQSSARFFARPTPPEKQIIKFNFIIHCVTNLSSTLFCQISKNL